jgi:predicted DNA-binding protein with PD1-like motif
MKANKDHESGNWQLRLDLEEEITETLTNFLKQENIRSGRIQGIGAVKDAVLGFFNTETNTYDKKTFEGEWELLSLLGNITIKDGEPFPHLHVMISGADYITYGGHLFSAIIAVTGELYIQPLSVPVERQIDTRTGLYLMT